MPDLTLPLPCERLLPHRHPMLLAGELVEVRAGYARVSATVGPENPFLDARGALDPMAAVELTAQTIAALRGYEAVLRGEPVHIGYLVGIKDFALEALAHAGDELEAEVCQEFAMEQVALMTAEVRHDGRRLAAGTIKIWEEREWPSAPPPDKFGVRASARAFPASPSALAPIALDAPAGADPLARAIAAAGEGFEPAPTENSIVAYFRFDDDFLGFRGHFPGYPILPAVIMPRLAIRAAAGLRDTPLVLRRIGHAKIGQGVFPGDRLRVECTIESAGADSIMLKSRMTGPRGAVGNFSLECAG